MTEDNLLPCPFCGGDDIQIYDQCIEGSLTRSYLCQLCGAQMYGSQNSYAAWNRRAQPAVPEGYEYRLVPKLDKELIKKISELKPTHGFHFIDGKFVHINDGVEHWPDPDLNCPACNGSGHKDDVPEGYALVPIEPTNLMIYSGGRARRHGLSSKAIYRAMIAAAQKEQV